MEFLNPASQKKLFSGKSKLTIRPQYKFRRVLNLAKLDHLSWSRPTQEPSLLSRGPKASDSRSPGSLNYKYSQIPKPKVGLVMELPGRDTSKNSHHQFLKKKIHSLVEWSSTRPSDTFKKMGHEMLLQRMHYSESNLNKWRRKSIG